MKFLALEKQQKEFNKGYYESIIMGWENKVALLSTEIERLMMINRKQTEEINSFHLEYQKMERSLKEHGVLKDDLLKVSEILKLKMLEAEEWRARANEKETELSKKHSNLSENENKIRTLSSEVERLTNIINLKTEENIALNQKVNSMQVAVYEMHSWKEKSNFFCDEIDRLNKINSEDKKELEEWRFKFVQYSNLTNKVNEQLGIIVLLTTEIECLRSRIKESEVQVEELRKSQLKI